MELRSPAASAEQGGRSADSGLGPNRQGSLGDRETADSLLLFLLATRKFATNSESCRVDFP
jgi:hypothetical protein